MTYHQSKEQLARESELVTEAKKDQAKFAVLYNRYFEQIFLFILKRVENEDTAADLTSQVFLKGMLNISKYKDMGLPFSSWLFRIARNEMYDLFRKKKLNMVVSLENSGIAEVAEEIGEEITDYHDRLTGALSELNDDEIELVEMRFFEKRAFKEIGEILEITENYAKVRTYRVLAKLKKILNHEI